MNRTPKNEHVDHPVELFYRACYSEDFDLTTSLLPRIADEISKTILLWPHMIISFLKSGLGIAREGSATRVFYLKILLSIIENETKSIKPFKESLYKQFPGLRPVGFNEGSFQYDSEYIAHLLGVDLKTFINFAMDLNIILVSDEPVQPDVTIH